MRTAFLMILLLAACGGGGGAPPEATEPAPEPVAHQEEHPTMSAELSAFHDALAPLWHDESPQRQAKTCDQADELLALARKVEGGAELVTSVEALQADCKAGGAQFADKFTAVHDRFHALMETQSTK